MAAPFQQAAAEHVHLMGMTPGTAPRLTLVTITTMPRHPFRPMVAVAITSIMPEPTMNTAVTEQLTVAGQAIEHESFAVIDAEVGQHAYSAEQWVIVRRMIHATADFNSTVSPRFIPRPWPPGGRRC